MLGTVLASHGLDGANTTWVLVHVVCEVVHKAVQIYPNSLLLAVVLGQIRLGDLAHRLLGRLLHRVPADLHKRCCRCHSLPIWQRHVHADVASEHGALQQGVPAKTVVAVNAAAGLARRIQAGNRFAVFVAENMPLVINGDAAHGVVNNWYDTADIKVFIELHWPMAGWEDRAVVWVAPNLRRGVVLLVSRAELRFGHAEELREVGDAFDLREQTLL
mmetsp:Transcript_8320/g.17005  ORF Transcript_8320/g.17005 Transcript_8320/m.17005 type:complete len:217 (+) Transcript_8320:259-909(+)